MPYRAVGLVTAGLPLTAVTHGGETFVTASLGRTFQIYNCTKLRQAFVGPPLPSGITALASHETYTIAACGSSIHVFKRAEEVATLTGEHEAPVRNMLTMGATLVSVDADGLLVAWQLPSGDVACRLHAGFVRVCVESRRGQTPATLGGLLVEAPRPSHSCRAHAAHRAVWVERRWLARLALAGRPIRSASPAPRLALPRQLQRDPFLRHACASPLISDRHNRLASAHFHAGDPRGWPPPAGSERDSPRLPLYN